MSNDNQPPDSPQVNLILDDSHGRKRVQKVKADTNRKTASQDFKDSWAHQLELPSRPIDALLQSSCWVGIGGLVTALLQSFPLTPVIYIPLGLTTTALLVVGGIAAERNRDLVAPLGYRIVLLLLGSHLGLSQ